MTVLVVEDNDEVYEAIMLPTVRELGRTPVRATSGEEAVERAAERAHAVIIMDLKLPGGISGIEAAARIRTLPAPYGTVPIVAVTGARPTGDEDKLGDARFDIVMLKPVMPSQLAETIRHYVRSNE